jgi:microcystin-dependent protein
VAEPFIGQITPSAISYPPDQYYYCNGQILQFAQFQALGTLLGNRFGGDMSKGTFGLPNLGGRTPIGYDGTHPLSLASGSESVTLTAQNMGHSHGINVSTTALADKQDPTQGVPGATKGMTPYVASSSNLVTLKDASIGVTGTASGGPHENRQPFLAMNFIIALSGVYPVHP